MIFSMYSQEILCFFNVSESSKSDIFNFVIKKNNYIAQNCTHSVKKCHYLQAFKVKLSFPHKEFTFDTPTKKTVLRREKNIVSFCFLYF